MRTRLVTLVGLTMGACVGVGLGWAFGLPELTALAIGVWSCAAMTFAMLRLSGAPTAPRAELQPPAVTRGETVALSLTFANPGTRRVPPTTFSGVLGSAGRRRIPVGALRPGEIIEVVVELDTPRREVMGFGPLTAERRDPLRIWSTTSEHVIDATLTVRPPVHPVGNLVRATRNDASDGSRTAQVHGGSDAAADLVGLRSYVPGDDLRRVHWRTSARLNEPHVVLVEPQIDLPAVVVVLDTRSTAGDAASFEVAVEAAASVAAGAATAGRRVDLATANGLVTGRSGRTHRPSGTSGADGATDVLDALAGIGPHPGGDIAAIVSSVDDGANSIVVCTPDAGLARAPVARNRRVHVVAWDGSRTLAEATSIGTYGGAAVRTALLGTPPCDDPPIGPR